MPTITGTSNGEELGDTLDNDIVDALGGNDIVAVRNGSDSVNGGAGTDTLVLRYGDTNLNVQGGVLSTAFLTGSPTRQVAFTGFERFDILTGGGNDSIDTGAGDDVIRTGVGSDSIDAGGGTDFLDGGEGSDTMRGGAGDDVYVVDQYGDVVQEAAGQGTDEIRTAIVNYTLSPASEVEMLTYTGTLNFQGTGNGLDNVITGATGNDFLLGDEGHDRLVGGLGNDILHGGLGNDTTVGGAGDDTHIVNSASDVVVELAGEGIDTVQAEVATFSIAGLAHVEKLTGLLTGSDHILTGNALDNEIRGSDGNDTLDGGAGADLMSGGAGNDTYIVDNVGDQIQELSVNGVDEVRTSLATFTMAGPFDNIENLVGTSASGQILTGNYRRNMISGGAGNDVIDGYGADGDGDVIDGGDGDDVMKSGGDGDTFIGGRGNDRFELDSYDDKVVEHAGEGTDEILLMFSEFDEQYDGFANVEKITGAWDIISYRIRGDGRNNIIQGNKLDDRLDGGQGADVLIGGLGNDTYVDFDDYEAIDTFVEGANGGSDTILTNRKTFSLAAYEHIENLTGDRFDGQTLVGNGLANTITGSASHDTIDGGAGADVMKGGIGDDVYIVDNAGDQVIESFGQGTDWIRTTLATFTMAAFDNVEVLAGTSSTGQSLTGNYNRNTIFGGAGNDVIDGGGNSATFNGDYIDGGDGDDLLMSSGDGDTFLGGKGNDRFVLDSYDDRVVEVDGDGIDEILLMFNEFDEEFDGFANVEKITGAWDILSYRISGDGRNNIIQGNKLNDRLDGGDGNDTLVGGDGGDELIGGAGNDLLDGGAGNDAMTGGIGNDSYVVDNRDDVVTELAGEGTDEIRTSLLNYVLGENVENLTYIGTTNANLRGNAGANAITGGVGDDFFQLQDGGSDRAIGGGGVFNTYYFGDSLDASDRVVGGDGFDQVILRGQIALTFGAGMFTGVETIALVSRVDGFFGQTSDIFGYTLVAHDSNLAAGKEMVVDGRVLLADERLVFDGSAERDGRFTLLGGRANDLLIGGGGNDEFIGGLGEDEMIGGLGDDIYSVNSLGDRIVEAANQGTDLVVTTLSSYTLAANFENLSGSFIAGQTLVGNGVANRIWGGGGGDVLKGMGGNDVYVVVAGDQVVELAGQGIDRVETALAAYTLTANVEDLTGTAATGQRFIGNDLNNRITGGAGNDNLAGGAGNDILVGGGGRDTFDGGAGFDRLEGGDGGDVYYVDTEDTVIELEGDGAIDAVYVRASFVLAAGSHVELLATTDFRLTTRIDLTGNELNNAITGSNGVNLLRGGGGSDSLRAYDGDDTLDGGAGIDQLLGGLGNDIYYVDTGDRITELAGEGTDTVYATASFDLTAGAEVEILAASDFRLKTRIDLAGNEFNNAVSGNNGVNVLRGGGGSDTLRGFDGNDTLDGGTGIDQLIGGLGNDTYHVDTGDRVAEAAGEGIDSVYASSSFVLTAASEVEVLATADHRQTTRIDLTGNEFNNRVTGNSGVNHLSGGGGNDNIDGLGGADQLSGGAGADRFLFTTALGGGNVDAILDFGNGADLFLLSGGSGQPFATLADGALAAGAFVTGTAAADANDRIVYNQQTGQIFYDADGNGAGAAILFATVTAGTQLSAADFLVI